MDVIKVFFSLREKIQANKMNRTKLALDVKITAMQSWVPLPNESEINICSNLLRNRMMIIDYTLYSIMQFYKNILIC